MNDARRDSGRARTPSQSGFGNARACSLGVNERRLELVRELSAVPRLSNTILTSRIACLAGGLYLFSFLMIAGGILFAPEGNPTRWFEEKQTMTSYSATLLYTCILVSVLNYLASRRFSYPRSATRSLTPFWALAAPGFLLLMADEFFAMHEGFGGFLAYRVLHLPKTPFYDKFDAFVIAFYGLCALAILAFYWRELRRISGFASFLVVGGVFACASLVMDMSPETVWTIYVEEGSKILANSSFLLACLSATVRNYEELKHDLFSTRSTEQKALEARR